MRHRAQARLIEAVLTIALVVPFSIYLLYYYVPPSIPDPTLHDAAATAVRALDENGVLLPLLVMNDTMRLRRVFRASLPGDVDFVLFYSQGNESPTRVGPEQLGAGAVQVEYVFVAPSGSVYHLTLVVWRR